MKIFTKEVKIALAAIVAIVAVYLLINFLKGVNVFKSSNTYYVSFANIQGLAVSNAVYANGYPVGTVRSIDYDYAKNDGVIVGIDLNDNVRLPRGTHAELEVSLMGDIKMNLILGKNVADNVEQGDTIQGGMYQGAMDAAANLVPVVAQMLPKMDSILTNLTRLSSDPALQQTLANAAKMSGDLATLSANLAQVSNSELPRIAANLNAISQNMNTFSGKLASTDVDATMQNLQGTITQMSQLTGELNGTVKQLNTKINGTDNTLGLMLNDRGLYDNLNRTANSADSLLTDLRLRPKRYVHFSIFGKKDK
ncbi:MAG: MlaD family protein [Alloprevotella sp.]|nr:MlaD family protein [Bacteroidales bacterium]MDY3943531.1 MlaD family protein [Alloprevotella sp.]